MCEVVIAIRIYLSRIIMLPTQAAATAPVFADIDIVPLDELASLDIETFP